MAPKELVSLDLHLDQSTGSVWNCGTECMQHTDQIVFLSRKSLKPHNFKDPDLSQLKFLSMLKILTCRFGATIRDSQSCLQGAAKAGAGMATGQTLTEHGVRGIRKGS